MFDAELLLERRLIVPNLERKLIFNSRFGAKQE